MVEVPPLVTSVPTLTNVIGPDAMGLAVGVGEPFGVNAGVAVDVGVPGVETTV